MADITNRQGHGGRPANSGGNDPTVEAGPHGAHETRDINVAAVTKFVVGVVIMTVAVMAVFWLTFNTVTRLIGPKAGVRPAMADANPRKQPPEPRLQTTPLPDLSRFLQGEEAILDHYGWVDPDKGIVRIPVERALELVAREGLPARGQEAARK